MSLIQKINNCLLVTNPVGLFLKKWKYCLLGCCLFLSCKSTDCGCPMANDILKKEKQAQAPSLNEQFWKSMGKE